MFHVGDCRDVLAGYPDDCVDLIYLDPPYATGRNWTGEAGGFSDKWAWDANCDDRMWNLPATTAAVVSTVGKVVGSTLQAYLLAMAERLAEVRRVLKPEGSVYLHCDTTIDSYLRLLMDAVFGASYFKNAVAWCYTGPANTPRHFPRKHDTLLFYAPPGDATFNRDELRVPYKEEALGSWHSMISGSRSREEIAALQHDYTSRGKVPEDWWANEEGMGAGGHMSNAERVGYPTQKPLALLRRVIMASSNKGDVVLDPYAGSGTTLVAAEELNRRWIGIDMSKDAATVFVKRWREHGHDLWGTRPVRVTMK